MMRSKTSKDPSRGFLVSSEISFLISVRKALPTSGQTIDVTLIQKFSLTKHPLSSKGKNFWMSRRVFDRMSGGFFGH